MLLDDDELKKYLLKQNREFGDRGWEGQGQMSLDKYGSESLSGREGWEDMIRQQLETNRFGDQSPNKSFAERNLPSGLGLLESREQAQQVLGHRLEDNMGPQLQPSFKDMMRTSADGTRIPFPEQNPAGNPSWEQTDALYDQGQSNYYGPSQFQNRISPLPHQLEGPETAPMMAGGPPDMYGRQMAHRGSAYDPNQKLYDQNYYGTAGQMGAPPPGIIPSSVIGTAMPGGKMPGLLESGGEIISQTLPPGQSTTEEDWQKQGRATQSTGEGGKWETEDSIFRRKKNKGNGMENYMAKYLMQLGNQISSDEDTGWRSN